MMHDAFIYRNIGAAVHTHVGDRDRVRDTDRGAVPSTRLVCLPLVLVCAHDRVRIDNCACLSCVS